MKTGMTKAEKYIVSCVALIIIALLIVVLSVDNSPKGTGDPGDYLIENYKSGTVAGTAGVFDGVTVTGPGTVTGVFSSGTATVNGPLYVTGDASIGGALTVGGPTILVTDGTNSIKASIETILGAEWAVLSGTSAGGVVKGIILRDRFGVIEPTSGGTAAFTFFGNPVTSSGQIGYNTASDSVYFTNATGGYHFEDGPITSEYSITSSGSVTLSGVLHLVAQGTPTSPTSGDIFMSSSGSRPYCYYGGTWNEL